MPFPAIVAAVPVVAKALDSVGGIFASIHLSGTKHMGGPQAATIADAWAKQVWPIFDQLYSVQDQLTIAPYACARFLSSMSEQWGLGDNSSFEGRWNADWAHDMSVNFVWSNGGTTELYRLVRGFMVWVCVNMDMERYEDELNHVVPAYFPLIFIGAVKDAGFDSTKLQQALQGVSLAGPEGQGNVFIGPTALGTGKQPPALNSNFTGSVNTAGVSLPSIGNVSSLLFIGVIVGGAILFMRRT